jgi:hypothetical protein
LFSPSGAWIAIGNNSCANIIYNVNTTLTITLEA